VRAALADRLLWAIVLLAGLAAMTCGSHEGQGAPNAIRDTEIENDIRTLASPVWRAAGAFAAGFRSGRGARSDDLRGASG